MNIKFNVGLLSARHTYIVQDLSGF